jgi:hypothetical protein
MLMEIRQGFKVWNREEVHLEIRCDFSRAPLHFGPSICIARVGTIRGLVQSTTGLTVSATATASSARLPEAGEGRLVDGAPSPKLPPKILALLQ